MQPTQVSEVLRKELRDADAECDGPVNLQDFQGHYQRLVICQQAEANTQRFKTGRKAVPAGNTCLTLPNPKFYPDLSLAPLPQIKYVHCILQNMILSSIVPSHEHNHLAWQPGCFPDSTKPGFQPLADKCPTPGTWFWIHESQTSVLQVQSEILNLSHASAHSVSMERPT